MPMVKFCAIDIRVLRCAQIPSLTLDLKGLAERLSKVDLAKRLFVESDLFPPELVLSLIGGRQTGNSSAKSTKVERTVVEMPDLIDMGYGDLLGEKARKAKMSNLLQASLCHLLS